MVRFKVKVHRVKDVLKHLSGVFISPVAERRQKRIPKDEEFNAYEGMPTLGDGNDESDDEGLPTDADSNADNQPTEADVPSAGTVAPTTGVDTRGFGLETFDGRGPTGAVRVRNGSTRPTELSL